MPGFIGVPELLLLGLVALLVFGPKRLPEMGRSLGQGMREFKDSVTGSGGQSNRSESQADSTEAPRESVRLIETAPAVPLDTAPPLAGDDRAGETTAGATAR